MGTPADQLNLSSPATPIQNPAIPQQQQGVVPGATPDPLQQLEQSISQQSSLSSQAMMQGAQSIQQEEQQLAQQGPPPQRSNKGFLSSAPFLIALSAIAGKKVGLHAQVMLGALNGIVSGALKGQEQAFNDSVQKWNYNRQRLFEVYQLQQQYYETLSKAYANNASGQLQAMKLAAQLANNERDFDLKKSIALANQGMDAAKLDLAEKQYVEKLKQDDIGNKMKQMQLQMKWMQLRADPTLQLTTNPRMEQILNALKSKYPTMPFGFGEKNMAATIKAFSDSNPNKSPAEIADMVFQGAMRSKATQEQVTFLARREAAVNGAVQTIVNGPNSLLNQALQVASKINFDDSRITTQGRLAWYKYAGANPNILQLKDILTEMRSDYAQAIQRGAPGSEGSQERANEAIPDTMSFSELQGLAQRLPMLAKQQLAGTRKAINDAIQQGQGSSAPQFASKADAVAAYRAGKITAAQLAQIMNDKGWTVD